jgi:intraflagellar transport protein 80
MRLKITQQPNVQHEEIITGIGWTAGNELYTCSDDKKICKWDMNGEPLGTVMQLDAYVTDFQWFPARQAGQGTKAASDVFVVGCVDGTFRLISKSGRVEKEVSAHIGAVVSLRWNHEGTALVTSGEDGVVKIWSRSGMLRSTLATLDRCVYSVAWSPDSDQVLFTHGKDLVIKPLQPASKQLQWKAHDAPVTCIDWNPINNIIISGAEDCRYKVWDCFGRQLFASAPSEFAVTCVTWSPNGQYFAVGHFESVRLCDRTGWAYSKVRVEAGSVMAAAFTADGTQLAGGGGNGNVFFGQLVDRKHEWKHIEVTLTEHNRIRVQDLLNETSEDLDFRDRVINVSINFGHLIVSTAQQCSIYNLVNLNTPHIIDLKDSVSMVVQCEKYFLMVDLSSGIQIYTYDGRLQSNPKFQGLRTEFLNAQSVALSNDCVAIIDRGNEQVVRLFDTATGKPMGEPVKHSMEMIEVSLNYFGAIGDRKLCIIDRNRDLYIFPIGTHIAGKPVSAYKLGTMCDSAMWNDETDMLGALMDSKFVVWYYPDVVFVDRDLIVHTRYTRDASSDLGKSAQFSSFFGTYCSVRRSDGALVSASVSPFALALYEASGKSDWVRALQLCRFVKDPSMWACLAAMALNQMELTTASEAYAAINEVDKLQYIQYIKNIPSVEARNAELCMFKHRPQDAEAILLQAGMHFRAIKLNIKLFNWSRALELAVQHKTHVDTVLGYRQRYLTQWGLNEENKAFLQYSQGVEVDWEKITAKKKQEKEKERGGK